MMISWRSLFYFFTIHVLSTLYTLFESGCIVRHDPSLFLTFGLALCRNLLLMNGIRFLCQKKPRMDASQPVETYPYEFGFHFLGTTFLDSVAVHWITNVLRQQHPSFFQNKEIFSLLFLPRFILRSFVFEMIFDGFHYTMHRLFHVQPLLYQYFHKHHHQHHHPDVITTFYHHPIDLMATNLLPLYLTVQLCTGFITNLVEWRLLLFYKIYIEMCGHLGREISPTSGFTQCVWLPRILGIQLYSEDHEAHHSLNHGNYAKRFSFWDRCMGTYKPGLKRDRIKRKRS